MCESVMHKGIVFQGLRDELVVFELAFSLKVTMINFNPIQGGGGGAHCAPPPPGKLSKISQERLEVESWNFLTYQMN